MEPTLSPITTLFQLNSSRSEFMAFIDAVKALGYKQGKDFFANIDGNASAAFKKEVLSDDKIKKLREKYAMKSFMGENSNDFVRTSSFDKGNKVKVIVEGKQVVGVVTQVVFGEYPYIVEAAGKVVKRGLHELTPFIEGKDKVVKGKRSLTESINSLVEEDNQDTAYWDGYDEGEGEIPLVSWKENPKQKVIDANIDYEEESGKLSETSIDRIISTANKYIKEKGKLPVSVLGAMVMQLGTSSVSENTINQNSDTTKRRSIISREMGNMSADEMIDEALGMYEADDTDVELEPFEGYSNCCGAPVYGETDVCPACKEHCEVIPTDNIHEEETLTEVEFFGDEDQEVEPSEAQEMGYPGSEYVINEKDRHEELVGKSLKEDHLSTQEQKIDFIIKYADYLPEDKPEIADLKELIANHREIANEQIANFAPVFIDALYHKLETELKAAGVDYLNEEDSVEDFDDENDDYGNVDFSYDYTVNAKFGPETPEYNTLMDMPEDKWLKYQNKMASCGTTVEYDSINDVFTVVGFQPEEEEEEEMVEEDSQMPMQESTSLTKEQLIEKLEKLTGLKVNLTK